MLLFDHGARPGAVDVERLLAVAPPAGGQGARLLHPGSADPGASEAGSAELLASGLSFDLHGLVPGASVPAPAMRHGFGLPEGIDGSGLEGLLLMPGPHIAAGPALMPVVRVMCGLAARLATLDGVRAVCWRPAGSWIEPGYFARTVSAWLEGGAFPALGLTALVRTADGGLESEGLCFFIGQELRVEPVAGELASATARIAVRALDMLVRAGRQDETRQFAGPSGETLVIEPEGDRLLRLWRAG